MSYKFEIPEAMLQKLARRVAKAAARAPRAGLPIPKLHAVPAGERRYEIRDPLAKIRGADVDTRVVSVPLVAVTLENFAPNIGDWRIVGYRSKVRRNNRVTVANSGDVPDAMREGALCCDHCGYVRNRHCTIIVERRDEGRERFQVGSTCAEAFLGSGAGYTDDLVEVGAILREFQYAATENWLSAAFIHEEVRTVLAVAWRRVCDDGFISSSEARARFLDPTWKKVSEDLAASRKPDACEEDMTVTAADFMVADDIIASYRNAEPETSFGHAVRSAIERGLAGMADVAVLTAAAHVHKVELEKRAAAEQARSLASRSVYVSDHGQRIEFVGKVRKISSFQGRWGERCYVTIFDADGNLMLWKTGGGHGLEEGMAYEMKGTVDKHQVCPAGPYEGAAQTVLSRVKVIAELGPATFEAVSQPQRLSEEDEEELDVLFGGIPGL